MQKLPEYIVHSSNPGREFNGIDGDRIFGVDTHRVDVRLEMVLQAEFDSTCPFRVGEALQVVVDVLCDVRPPQWQILVTEL